MAEPTGARMKHTTSRMLFAYWDALRGDRAAPERSEIRPGGLRHVLADAFILARDGIGPGEFRLAGTRCSALFCRELQGRSFADLWSPELRTEPSDLVDTVVTETVGLVASLESQNANGSALPLELLLLPLRHRGKTDVRLVGTLSPGAIPSWAGLVPITEIRTRSLRIIQAASRERFGTRRAGAPSQRNLFVIHEGGRPPA